MAPTPPERESVEPVAQSPDEEAGSPSMDANDEQGLGVYEFEFKEQDRWLPIANVARIMKLALPDNAKIAKEAKECMQECVSEFISFITSEASERCQHEKRKTVNGEDILYAMTSLGFDNYSEALKIYLGRYRETQMASQNKTGTGPDAAGGRAAADDGGPQADADMDSNGGLPQSNGGAHASDDLDADADAADDAEIQSQFDYSVGHHNGTAPAY